jgi:PAS domain S-box-containing protein
MENGKREIESVYHIFQDLTDFAIFTIDANGDITSWNRGTQRIFGYEEKDIIGSPLAVIFCQSERTQAEREIAEARRHGRAEYERWHQRKNGSLFWASGILSAVYDNGTLTGFVKILRDLTERQRAAQQRERLLKELQESMQVKDRFLAILSHELRTPLAAIVGWSSLLYKGQLRDDQITTAVESIYRNANVQSGLIQDLLDMSRIATGQLRMDVAPVNVSELVGNAVDSVQFMAMTKGIQITSRIAESWRPVHGDARRLQQMLWNLLSNSIKFTPSGGQVTLEVQDHGKALHIVVTDNGQGMTPDFLPYAFDMFRQEQDTNTRLQGGLGLGLALVKQLAELHGGSVKAFSAGPGQGSTFTLTLPVLHGDQTAADEKADGQTPTTLQAGALAGKFVLILENDPDCREFIHFAVQHYGGRAVSVSIVSEALLQFAASKPDIVIADLALPDEDGFSFINKLQALQREVRSHVPVIALTAVVSDSIRDRALSEGFTRFVAKPIAVERLIGIIFELLNPAPPNAG